MITTTWTKFPADLLGLGSAVVRPCIGIQVAVSPDLRAPITSAPGTGLPVDGTAVRMRPAVRQAGADAGTAVVTTQTEPRTTSLAHNYIAVASDGTTLGIPPSRRPQS